MRFFASPTKERVGIGIMLLLLHFDAKTGGQGTLYLDVHTGVG